MFRRRSVQVTSLSCERCVSTLPIHSMPRSVKYWFHVVCSNHVRVDEILPKVRFGNLSSWMG